MSNVSGALPSIYDKSQRLIYSKWLTKRFVFTLIRNQRLIRLFIFVIFGGLVFSNHLQAKEPINKNIRITEGAQYLWHEIKDPEIHKIYSNIFSAYLGLSWVNKPVLGNKEKIFHLTSGEKVSVYSACRPHACATEKLVFALNRDTNHAWGKINIHSELEGNSFSEAIQQIIDNEIEVK